jgi:predicted kinase
MEKTLIIIRGLPGSGKSTLAHWIKANAPTPVIHCEADQFFMGTDGKYRYIPHLVPAAHEWCRRAVTGAMQEGFPTIIVSNTSTVTSKIQFYLDMAKFHGYRVQQLCVFADFGSVHNVPEHSMEKFKEQLRASLIHELMNGDLL